MLINRIYDCCSVAALVLDGAYGWVNEAIAIVLFVLIFNFLAKWILKKLHHHFEKNNKIWKDSFVQALYSPLSAYVWFFAIVHTVDLISHRVFEGTFLENMHLVLNIGLILAIAWFLMRWKNLIVNKLRSKSARINQLAPGKIDVINKTMTVVILFLVALFILETTGQNISTLIAFGGIGGLAIAFASQEMISNFFGGLMIYMTQPFGVGDWINLPEHNVEGNVEEIGWYTTRIRTFEKRPVYIPNSMFSKAVVMTPSRMSHRKFDETIGIRYEDIPQAKKIISDIKSMLDDSKDVDHRLNAAAHLIRFGSYSVDIRVAAYLLDISSEGYMEAKQDILFKIYDIIISNNAELAFPTQRNIL